MLKVLFNKDTAKESYNIMRNRGRLITLVMGDKTRSGGY
jgi:hypothetical protein